MKRAAKSDGVDGELSAGTRGQVSQQQGKKSWRVEERGVKQVRQHWTEKGC